MSTSVNMSIYGLYKYDDTIFDNFHLPIELDKNDFIYNLVLECAEMTLLYPDADMMKEAIGRWSSMRLHTWERVAQVLYEDYDPFINIKRDERREITQTRDLQDDGTSTDKVNAWNSGEGTERGSTTMTGTQTGDIKTVEHFHVEGDSAITDAQDVARKEIELRSKNDLYNYIINDFKNKFCLLIY